MKILYISLLFIVLVSCDGNNKRAQQKALKVEDWEEVVKLSKLSTDSNIITNNKSNNVTDTLNDCLPCCENCPVKKVTEMSGILNDTINVIYVLMKGFEDKDCCIYSFAELVNNRPFAEYFKEQYVFLLDIDTIYINEKINKLLPSDTLKKYVIAKEYYNLKGMTTVWNPFKNVKYLKYSKYKDL